MGFSNINNRIRSINGIFILDSNPHTGGTHALIKVNL